MRDRGAIIVVGVFLAPFLVGTLYFMVAIANTLVMREGLQAAADATAFSPAVLSARGMNMIVVMNWLMVAIVAVLLPMRALLPAYAAVAAMYHCPSKPLCPCMIHQNATSGESGVAVRSAIAEQRAEQLLRALSDAQALIARQVPRLGAEAATRAAERNPELLAKPIADTYSPSLGAEGCKLGLPVEEDSFRAVCKRTKPYLFDLAYRMAQKLGTLGGSCTSGGMALGIAASALADPEHRNCWEASKPACFEGGGGGAHPKRVYVKATNGNGYMQFWTKVDGKGFDYARKGVELGAFGERADDPLAILDMGYAESEIYFDCASGWGDRSCNGDSNAMWNTRWTARLRRVHDPEIEFPSGVYVHDVLANASFWSDARGNLMRRRRVPFTPDVARTDAARKLLGSQEGPLQ